MAGAEPRPVASGDVRRPSWYPWPEGTDSAGSHIDDAVASLEIELSDDEVARLEAPYTPRYDFQGISDDAELARISRGGSLTRDLIGRGEGDRPSPESRHDGEGNDAPFDRRPTFAST